MLSSLLAEPYTQFTEDDYKCEYSDKVINDGVTHLRGFMMPNPDGVDQHFIETGIPVMKAWGANIARYQLCKYWGNRPSFLTREEYMTWVAEYVEKVKPFMEACAANDIKVVFDIHVAPGGRDQYGEMHMFYNEEYVNTFIDAWKYIAENLKGTPGLYAYDLINEPYQTQKAPIDYMDVQYRAAKAVREIDPDTPIIVACNINSRPQEFVYMTALPLKDIIYQVHMYQPDAFTHQGVFMPHKYGTVYPGIINGFYYDKDKLRKVLEPVRDFQLRHNARIYVGEFSAIRWANGADRYLDDVIGLFEEYGWDWSYHAFREWTGWSIEHTGPFNPNPKDPNLIDHSIPAEESQDNPRKTVLLKYLGKNLK